MEPYPSNSIPQLNNSLSNLALNPSNQRSNNNDFTLNQHENEIMRNITNIQRNINAQQSKFYLQEEYNKHGQDYIFTLFSIVYKLNESLVINYGESYSGIQIVLLYLRYFIYEQKYRLPEITQYFVKIYKMINDRVLKELVVSCFGAFLSKNIHTIYVKNFLMVVGNNLQMSLQMDFIKENQLELIIDILDNLNESKYFQPGLSRAAQTIMRTIIQRHSTKIPSNISPILWIRTVITLCTFTKCSPTLQFINQILINLNSFNDVKLHVKAFQMFNRVYDRFYNLQQLYYILQVQVKRMLNQEYIKSLEHNAGVEGVQQFLKTIKLIMKQTLGVIRQNNESDINMHVLRQYFTSQELFITILANSLNILQKYKDEQNQLITINIELIEIFVDWLEDFNQIESFIGKVKHKIPQEYLFCLLAGLPTRNIMQLFKATDVLIKQTREIIKLGTQTRSVLYNMFIVQLYLQFVIKYLNVYEYLERPQIEVSLKELHEEYINRLAWHGLNCAYDAAQTTKYNENVGKIKAYGIGIVCRLQKYKGRAKNNEDKVHNTVNSILYQSYEIIQRTGDGESGDQVVCVISQAIKELTHLKVYKSVLYHCLITYFTNQLQLNTNSNKSKQQYLYLKFLKILEDAFNITYLHQDSYTKLYNILKMLLKLENKAIQDQVCELVLEILFQMNTVFHEEKIGIQQMEAILSNLYNTGVYEYIQSCLLKEDEDYLYCKILMETIFNQNGCKLVSQILAKVCPQPQKYNVNHSYDKVWEALVILYGVSNPYTESKGINSRIEKIMGGNIEALLEELSIDEQKIYKQKAQKQNKKRIDWTWLPQVRRILEPGSYVGVIVEHKLNQNRQSN